MAIHRSNLNLAQGIFLGACLLGISTPGISGIPRGLSGPRSGWGLDSRFGHNHYYPGQGQHFRALPQGRLEVPFGHRHYYYHAGVWYRPWGSYFSVVLPPVGILLPLLPPDCVLLDIAGGPFYYANGTYYRPWPEGGYVVVDPPEDHRDVKPAPPKTAPPSSILSVFPKNGQSEERMDRDREDAERFAVGQSGFDPARTDPANPKYLQLRQDYLRAFKAFMEGRGYTVK